MSRPTPPTQTPEQQYHAILLERLQRLIRVQREYARDVNSLGERMLSRAIIATIGDLYDCGMEREVSEIMEIRR